jgi:hypothetical protein
MTVFESERHRRINKSYICDGFIFLGIIIFGVYLYGGLIWRGDPIFGFHRNIDNLETSKSLKALTQQDLVLCCYYRQHFHEAMCNDNGKGGCVISAAIPGGIPPKVSCSKELKCSIGEYSTGYFLDSFRLNCQECMSV